MAKREALRELSRYFPAPRETETILNSLRDKDDLHVATIGVSIVEATLEKLITTRLKYTDRDFLPRLFDNRGPMSDFNSKILVAQAFGVVTSPLAGELHTMRKIRNAFAHARIHVTFATKPIAEEVDRLKLIASLRGFKAPGFEGEVEFSLDGKSAFLLAVRLVLILMNSIGKRKSTAEKVLERALKKK